MSYQSYSRNLAKSHHENATQEPLLTVIKFIDFNRAIHIILEKLLINMVEKKKIKNQLVWAFKLN